MADGVEISKDSLDALGGVFQVGATFSDVSRMLQFSGTLAAAFPAVGAILGLIGNFLSDGKHEEILRGFKELSNKIDHVRDDIRDLKNVIRWEIAELQYGDDVGRIELGMQYCLEIGKRRGHDEREQYQKRLKQLCANENCALALNAIFDGIIGDCPLRSSTILDKFYHKTGGHRSKTSALATRLLQLTVGGMMVISTYETMERGKKAAADITKRFYHRLNEAPVKAKSVINKCVNNFEGNMLKDLNTLLDIGKRNKDLVGEISAFMSEKYDWLENYCLVYNDLHGFDNHCIGGIRVESLHRNGKCGIVFYRKKDEKPRFSNRYNEAYKINDDTGCKHAQKGYNKIVAKLDGKGIGWTGCAVIKRWVDLWFVGTFSTKIATVVGKKATAIILLR